MLNAYINLAAPFAGVFIITAFGFVASAAGAVAIMVFGRWVYCSGYIGRYGLGLNWRQNLGYRLRCGCSGRLWHHRGWRNLQGNLTSNVDYTQIAHRLLHKRNEGTVKHLVIKCILDNFEITGNRAISMAFKGWL